MSKLGVFFAPWVKCVHLLSEKWQRDREEEKEKRKIDINDCVSITLIMKENF